MRLLTAKEVAAVAASVGYLAGYTWEWEFAKAVQLKLLEVNNNVNVTEKLLIDPNITTED